MGKGKRYELSLKNSINECTHEWVKAHRPDYSGSSVGEVADLMVVWEAQRYGDAPRHVAYIELKKRGNVKEGNRKIVMSGSSDGESGLDELQELISQSPSWTDCHVAVKFPNRELIVLDAEKLWKHLVDEEEDKNEQFHNARLTPSDNISMVKPTLDSWPSTQNGENDRTKLLHAIGVENYDIIEK